MEKTFDFNTIGKRMPYTVPDGFFDKMEEDVVASLSSNTTGEKPKKARIIKIAVRSVLSAAAALALFFVVRATLPKSEPVLALADDFASVELAFNNLSIEDQDFLIQVYEDEEYINVLTNTEDCE